MYAKGQGVAQDYIHAHMWFNLAAANEAANDTPLRNLRDIAADMMTPSQIEEVRKLARECKKRNY